MALTPGTRLGPYEITAAVGAGGMGEVYRATDTNLKRQVALKVLPAAMASDADRLARFQREAEGLAGRFLSVSFQVDDIDVTYRTLLERGVTFVQPPEKQPWGGTLAFLNDPDGNILTLVQ